MKTPLQLTNELYERRLNIQNRVVLRTQRLWKSLPFEDLDGGWDKVGPVMLGAVTNGQLASATLSPNYVSSVSRYLDFSEIPATTAPELYAGIAPDGRELAPLMYGAVTKTKQAVGAGQSASMAFEIGAGFLAAVVKTAISQMGGASDQSLLTGRGYKTYLRAVSPNACSRCAILAGIYSSAVAFQRHPNCQCIAVPSVTDPKKLKMGYTNPEEYFNSLSEAEQNKIFTNAGAKAVREGADLYQVVNARRGASGIAYDSHYNPPRPNSGNRMRPVVIGRRADGTELRVYATGEGTSRRGNFGYNERRLTREAAARGELRRSTTLRLMPEQIFQMSEGDPIRARELLIRYGYIYP